jgi:hypothetical protein
MNSSQEYFNRILWTLTIIFVIAFFVGIYIDAKDSLRELKKHKS